MQSKEWGGVSKALRTKVDKPPQIGDPYSLKWEKIGNSISVDFKYNVNLAWWEYKVIWSLKFSMGTREMDLG